MRRIIIPLVAALGFGTLQWLRWPEPPGLDQSLFVFYGQWLGRGLVLYRDLWDSKPPGIFWVYAVAVRIAGSAQAPRLLDALAAAAASALAFALLRDRGAAAPAAGAARWRLAAWSGAIVAAGIWSAPPFGGAMVAAQAEVLLAPLVLGAVLVGRRAGARAGTVAGLLLGCAACLKIVAVVLLPLAWLGAPRVAARRRSAAILAGFLVPVLACAAWLAAHGALAEGVRAVLVYPRAYAAEITSRMPLAPAIGRGLERFWRGLPLTMVLALAGAALPPRSRLVGPSLAWLALAALGVVAQRQMAGYHLLLLAPPLALLAGLGVERVADGVRRASRAARHDARAVALLVFVAATLAFTGVTEFRLWVRAYAPHVDLRRGRIAPAAFLARLGGPGPAWLEAESLVGEIQRAAPSRPGAASPGRDRGAAARGDSLFVWGLAPQLYALAGLAPATRYVFHQTFYVEDSPLSRRWPDARVRRAELLAGLQRVPPRWVVVVSGDRSGLEPVDSKTELEHFPALAEWLTTHYRSRGGTRAYELLERLPAPD